MVTAVEKSVESPPVTIGDLFRDFGAIPLSRVLTVPVPGSATEADVIRLHERDDRLCELVDGVLVEKSVGAEESELAVWIAVLLSNYVRPRKLGAILGPDGPIRLRSGLVRMPDVCLISRHRLPHGKLPKGPILDLPPNLAVEVLSGTNTAKEMRRKVRDYFEAGVALVWLVDARARTVEVFTAPDRCRVLKPPQTLGGGDVLPRLKIRLSDLFSSPLGD
ncbi:MAG: Uma2 family endonuclease [Planctomycetaceae bacterium]